VGEGQGDQIDFDYKKQDQQREKKVRIKKNVRGLKNMPENPPLGFAFPAMLFEHSSK
jgi:hypothetical protein